MLAIVSLVHGGADQSFAINSLEKQKQGHSSSLYRRFLCLKPYPVQFRLPLTDMFADFIAALGHLSHSHTAGVMALLAETVLGSQLSFGISLCARFPFPHTSPSSLWNRKYGIFIFILPSRLELTNVQIVGDDTTALSSVLKADVWRDHLLAEEARLNARLVELDASPPGESDARLEEMRDEVSGRLADVHANLADMDAESGPARAAALLAGGLSNYF